MRWRVPNEPERASVPQRIQRNPSEGCLLRRDISIRTRSAEVCIDSARVSADVTTVGGGHPDVELFSPAGGSPGKRGRMATAFRRTGCGTGCLEGGFH